MSRVRACIDRFRRHAGREDGAVLVFVAILLTALLAAAAMSLDLGASRQAQEQAQVAADAGALAAAGNASSNAANESQTATSIAQENDPGSTVSFSGANKVAQVGVSGAGANGFGSALGVNGTRVSASATASSTGGENDAAIFAKGTGAACSGNVSFQNNGSDTSGVPSFIDGSVDSNGTLTFAQTGGQGSSNDIWFDNPTQTTIAGTTIPAFSDALTYAPGCSTSGLPIASPSQMPSGQPAQRTSALTNWPVDYTSVAGEATSNQYEYNLSTGCAQGVTGQWPSCNGAQCTYWEGASTVNPTWVYDGGNNQNSFSDNGVYCWDHQVTFENYNYFSGNLTILAEGITVQNVTHITATPLINNDLLFDCVGGTGYSCSFNTQQFTGGTIFAPNNTIQVNSTSDLVIHGYLEGQSVAVTSNDGLQLTGNGPPVSGTPVLTG